MAGLVSGEIGFDTETGNIRVSGETNYRANIDLKIH